MTRTKLAEINHLRLLQKQPQREEGVGIVHAEFINSPQAKSLLHNLYNQYADAVQETENAADMGKTSAEEIKVLVVKQKTIRKIIEYVSTDINSIVKGP